MAGLPRSGKNIWKMNFFPGQGKVEEFVDGHGNLKRTWKVKEKNKCRQSPEFIILLKRGKDVLSHEIV